jgi:UDP-N-acetylmuramate dehydrogenase
VSGLRSAAVEEAAAILGPKARRDRPLGPLTTYRVGGPAALFVEVGSEEDLDAAHQAVARSGVSVLVLGKGSNLLVADRGFDGLVVSLGPPFRELWLEDEAGADEAGRRVRVGGAASLPAAARQTVVMGLSGFEWAVGVPGSFGGAVRMNAGGHGSDMAACLADARLVDLRRGDDRVVGAEQLELGYRRSAVSSDEVVVSGWLALRPGERRAGEALVADIVRWRREHQPGGQNAGSVFTNPPGDAAGRLVEEAGQKGRRLGAAQVSPKHANFIQADQGGSADDVLALIEEVRAAVAERCGVQLELELRLVGFEGSRTARA